MVPRPTFTLWIVLFAVMLWVGMAMLQAQQAQDVTTPAETPMETAETASYITSAALIMYAQKFLKQRGWYKAMVAAVPMADAWVHRAVAAIGSLIAAVGINYTLEGTMDAGWKLTVGIPNAMELLGGLWEFTKVYGMQQIAYDATKAKVTA